MTDQNLRFDARRDLVWVNGPDAVSFLQGLVSQDITGMEPGTIARTFLLGPQGKLRAVLWALRGEERVGLLTDAGHGDRVVSDLSHYRIRVKAEIHLDPGETWEVHPAGSLASAPTPGRWTVAEEGLIASLPIDVAVGVGLSPPVGLSVGTDAQFESVRVEAEEPVFGLDVDESTIPQETGLVEESVSFAKGCYLGQELVARIDTRGHVNRYLRKVETGLTSVPVGPATAMSEGRQVGVITSWGLGSNGVVGLGMLRREVEIGRTIQLDTTEGSTEGRVLARTGAE